MNEISKKERKKKISEVQKLLKECNKYLQAERIRRDSDFKYISVYLEPFIRKIEALKREIFDQETAF